MGHKDPSTDLWILLLPTGRMWTSPTSDAVTTTPTLPRPGPCIDRAPHPPEGQSDTHPGVNMPAFTHLVQTLANAVKFAHQSLCSPKISSLLKAVRWGFLKGCPNMKETLILKYLNPSAAIAKGHMKHPCQGIRSTWPKVTNHAPTPRVPVPIIDAVPIYVQPHIPDPAPAYPGPAYGARMGPHANDDDGYESIANIFCFGVFADKNSGIVYHNLIGLFPFMSFDGSVCFFVLYHYESNAILVTPIAGLDDISIFNLYKKYSEDLTAKGFKPKLNIMDNQATKQIKIFSPKMTASCKWSSRITIE